MKAFLAALTALLVLTALVAVNSVLICRRIDRLLQAAELLPESDVSGEEAKEAVEALYSLWDVTVEPLSLTVGYQLIDRADDAVEEMISAVKSDGGSYVQARRRFIDALKRMRKLQGLTFTGVF